MTEDKKDLVLEKTQEEFTSMDQLEFKPVRRGQRVTGKVFQVDDNVIYVTLENNAEARMYLEYYGKSIDTFVGEVNEGDTIEAVVSTIKEDDEFSMILLDRKALEREANLQQVEEIYKEEKVVSCKVTKVDDRGLHVNVLGFNAFLPYGLLDRDLINKKETLKGQTLDVNIIEVKPGRRPRIIASRKKIFEQKRMAEREERNRMREEEFETIQTGDVLKGRVERIEPHMALIRFNYVTGRLRISQIQHSRIESINDIFQVGDEVTVKVIKKDKSLDLSIKALLPTPFETFEETHKKGDVLTGEVVQKLPFGIIIELQEGVRGLLHNSEFSWNPNDNFQAHVKIGDLLETVITLIDAKRKKISLSRRLLIDNPWKDVNFKRGEVATCKVLEVTEAGLLVESKGVNGFIDAQEVSVEKDADPNKLFAVGDTIEARVTEVNPKNWHLKLSVKQLIQANVRSEFEQHLTEDVESTTLGDLFADVLDNEETEEPNKE